MDSLDPKPKRRPRVSLLRLFLLTALAATSLTTIMLWREVGPLRTDKKWLQQQSGSLRVSRSDQDQAHAIIAPLRYRNEWTVNVYLPPGSKYDLLFSNELVPRLTGEAVLSQKLEYLQPTASYWSERIEPGHHSFSIRFENVSINGKYAPRVRVAEVGQSAAPYSEQLFSPVEWSSVPGSFPAIPPGSQLTFDRGEPIPLMLGSKTVDARAAIPAGLSDRVPERAMEEIAVWLQPVPAPLPNR